MKTELERELLLKKIQELQIVINKRTNGKYTLHYSADHGLRHIECRLINENSVICLNKEIHDGTDLDIFKLSFLTIEQTK